MSISPTGIEIVADLYGIEGNLLKDVVYLTNIFRNVLVKTDFSIIKEYSHKFEFKGEGVTGIFLLSESHASFHSYPEWGSLAIDIFSCGKAKPQKALEYIIQELKPNKIHKSEIDRNFIYSEQIDCINSLENISFFK